LVEEGELHARAFEHFKIAGSDLREAVIKLRIPDDEAERLAARWHAHGRELFLGSTVVGDLRKLLSALPESLSDNALLASIKGALSANALTIHRLSDDIHTRDAELAALHEAKLRVERDAAEAEQDATAEATQLATALRSAREQLAAAEEQIRSLRNELATRAPQEPTASATVSPSPGGTD
jgi:chromosome segregation ATPase